jgi:hypothetical protein
VVCACERAVLSAERSSNVDAGSLAASYSKGISEPIKVSVLVFDRFRFSVPPPSRFREEENTLRSKIKERG